MSAAAPETAAPPKAVVLSDQGDGHGGQPTRAALVELFAGIGCVARGFARSGQYEPAVLTDADSAAEAACQANGVPGSYVVKDIRRLEAADVVRLLDGRPAAGLLGCPPCQGFSAAGARRADDERNSLLKEFFRFLELLQPAFFMFENVPSALRSGLFAEALVGPAASYSVWSGVVNAALFGVPQTRQRAIVIGYRRDLAVTPNAPRATHGGSGRIFDYGLGRLVRPRGGAGAGALGLYAELGRPDRLDAEAAALLVLPGEPARDLVTVGDALGDLPSAGVDDGSLAYSGVRPSPYAARLRDGGDSVRNHRAWRHRPDFVDRLRAVPEGGGLPELAGRRRSRPYFSQAYTRLHRSGLARTVTTNFHNPGCGRFLHYSETRSITVREAMRLQGIEDAFSFDCDPSVQERLVGNAFPLPLAEALAEHIACELAEVLPALAA